MEYFGKQPKFEIQPIIEQRPFESPAVQSFFAKWCEINSSIQLQIISRNEWESTRIKGILEKRPGDKQALFIPKDLQLWEMIGTMEMVDYDTFTTKLKRQTETKEKLSALAKTFQNTGTYIAQRLHKINEGREIAKVLALEFYEYGQSLAEGKRPEKTLNINQIASQNLPSSDTETVDRFLTGDILYKSRRKRVEQAIAQNPSKKDELYEAERQKTLIQFFRVAKKAFDMQAKGANGTLQKSATQLKPWQSDASIHSAFLKKIKKAITQEIETPKREFEGSIFRRGMELLQRNMPFGKLPHRAKEDYLHWQNGEATLRQALQIDTMRTDLEAARQADDPGKISQKELEIADRIQNAVSNFPYHLKANNPAEMITSQYINCIGASTLGGALMKEAGLHYLVGDVPEHSILFLITSDGKLEWRDMLNNIFNEYLTDDMITGTRQDGLPLTIADIVAFSRNPKPQGLMFDIKSPHYREKLQCFKEGERQYVTVFEPEYGQQIQILNSVGNAFRSLGRNEEAVEAYRRAVVMNPKDIYPYNGLGGALRSLDRNEEAVEVYRQAVAINPKYTYSYSGLGNALRSLGRNEEAVEAYRQAMAINPKHAYSYNELGNALRSLGRNEEAIEVYQMLIGLIDKEKDRYLIEQFEQIIAKLKT